MPATAAIPEELIVQRALFAERLHAYREAGLKVFASSSFQTHSIPMLHLISELDPQLLAVTVNGYIAENPRLLPDLIRGLDVVSVVALLQCIREENPQLLDQLTAAWRGDKLSEEGVYESE